MSKTKRDTPTFLSLEYRYWMELDDSGLAAAAAFVDELMPTVLNLRLTRIGPTNRRLWLFPRFVNSGRRLPAGHLPIFCSESGVPWTSLYFRQQFLYPCLRRLKAAGDPYLQPLDASGRNSIEARFWSLHCYRLGTRSHVSRSTITTLAATKDMIYEHARWR